MRFSLLYSWYCGWDDRTNDMTADMASQFGNFLLIQWFLMFGLAFAPLWYFRILIFKR